MEHNVGYADIAEHYRKAIRDGALRPGDRLPTQQQAIDEWGVSSATVYKAYRTLKREGLTTATVGVGTIVARHGSDNTATRVRTHALTGTALATGEESRVIEVGVVGADEQVAYRLDVAAGSPVHMRRRIVSRDGAPVHMSTSYYPAYVVEATPELTETASTGGSRELAAERLGVAQGHALEEVTSRMATDEEKAAFGYTGSVIVTQVIRTVYLTDGRIVEVAVKICHGSTALRWSTPLT